VWQLFLGGHLQLVPSEDGELLSFAVASTATRAERQAVARQNARLAKGAPAEVLGVY
jgi:hypothetical protein